MKRIEQQVLARLETAGGFRSPAQMRDLKIIRKKFGVVYFVDPKDAMVFAKGKGFKVINHGGADAENGQDESDMEFLYEVTDKSGNTVGLISGTGHEGEGYICPSAQHYKKWEAYQHSQPQRS